MTQTADDALDLPNQPDQGPTAPPPPPALSLDGELPRLGSSTPAPTVQHTAAAEPIPPVAATQPSPGLDLPSLPTLPTATPVLADPSGIPAPDAGYRPDRADEPSNEPATSDHPMAHMMPKKSAPSEASRQAAAIRAAKKAKARKVKAAVAIGAIAVGVLAGPPLYRWFSDALAEAGSTSTEQPAD